MAEYFLVGDSHIGAFHHACLDARIPVAGGGNMGGTYWHSGQFNFRDRNFHFPTADAQDQYKSALGQLDAQSCADVAIPFVLSLGYHTRALLVEFPRNAAIDRHHEGRQFISTAALERWIWTARKPHFDAVEQLCALGKTVFAIVPPQRDNDVALARRLTAIISHELSRLGASVIDINPETCGADFKLKPEFHRIRQGDNAHGNLAYGQLLLQAVETAHRKVTPVS